MAKFHITDQGLRVVGATQYDVIEVLSAHALSGEREAHGAMSLKIGDVVVNSRTPYSAADDDNTVYLDIGKAGDASYTVARVDGDVRVTNDSTGQLVAVLHNAKHIVMGQPSVS